MAQDEGASDTPNRSVDDVEGSAPEPGDSTAAGDEQDVQPLALYPEALYTHQEVVDSETAFAEALAAVHEHMGCNTDKIPKMAGKDMDLHTMYKTVTGFGGCVRVTGKKMWKDVAEVFHLPPTITSSSYTLKRVYLAYMWDMEQVYFNGHANSPVIRPPDKDRNEESMKRKKSGPDNVMKLFPALPPGHPTALTGFASGSTEGVGADCVGIKGSCVIDARFDCGYFCSIKFGKQEFKGVLYCPPPECTIWPPPPPPEPASTKKRKANEDLAAIALGSLPLAGTPKSTKKDKNSSRDPNAPKPNKTAFNYFSADVRDDVKRSNPGTSQIEVTKKVGEKWQNAADDVKDPYIAMAMKDKQRYLSELQAYKCRADAERAQAMAEAAAQAVAKAVEAAAAGQPMTLKQLDLDVQTLAALQETVGPVAPAKDRQAKGRKGKGGDSKTEKGTPGAVPAHAAGAGMETLVGAASYAMQVGQPVQVGQAVEVGSVPGLAVGQVAYDANGNPLSAVPIAAPTQQ